MSRHRSFLILAVAVLCTETLVCSQTNNATLDHRRGKLPMVRASVCPTPDNKMGICYTESKCKSLGLTPAGSCLSGPGVCCIASKTCEQTSSSVITYFRNPSTLPPRCTLKISKVNSTITQLRLDFISFTLQQPSQGKCTNFLMLSQTDPTLPKICGENSGNHVYVEFDPQCDEHVLQFTFGNQASSDKWLIQVTQVSSNSDLEAPTRCLMYYNNNPSGTVTSLNFGVEISDTDTRQLSPLHYGVCIKPLPGYCQIQWSLGEMSISNDAGCDSNYVEIPCTVDDTGTSIRGRYCSEDDFSMLSPTSICTPFMLFVVNNLENIDSAGTNGFTLNFRQTSC